MRGKALGWRVALAYRAALRHNASTYETVGRYLGISKKSDELRISAAFKSGDLRDPDTERLEHAGRQG